MTGRRSEVRPIFIIKDKPVTFDSCQSYQLNCKNYCSWGRPSSVSSFHRNRLLLFFFFFFFFLFFFFLMEDINKVIQSIFLCSSNKLSCFLEKVCVKLIRTLSPALLPSFSSCSDFSRASVRFAVLPLSLFLVLFPNIYARLCSTPLVFRDFYFVLIDPFT